PLGRPLVPAGPQNPPPAPAAPPPRLADRGILYAPDYVVNAGGIISVAHEYLGHSTEDEVRAEVNHIPERLQAIFVKAKESGEPTNLVADDLARRIVAAGNSDKKQEIA
ncbi:MAG: hypothetical protein O7B81_14345, partial [Gammaproteobacteria bacterium]|nr:hypothetical protein [Gammaproteobacteria bacterium]